MGMGDTWAFYLRVAFNVPGPPKTCFHCFVLCMCVFTVVEKDGFIKRFSEVS